MKALLTQRDYSGLKTSGGTKAKMPKLGDKVAFPDGRRVRVATWLSAGDGPTLFTDRLADLLPAAGDEAEATAMAAIKLPVGWLPWFGRNACIRFPGQAPPPQNPPAKPAELIP